MTGSEDRGRVKEPRPFNQKSVAELHTLHGRYTNWPIVYTLNNARQVYVGETIHGTTRMAQHLKSESKSAMRHLRFIIGEEFNKSAALDLECQLISMFAADGKYKVINKVEGISRSDYFDRDRYQDVFDEIFEELRDKGMLTRTVQDLVNSDLYKLSPFKSLNEDQLAAVDLMVPRVLDGLESGTDQEVVVQGGPGTGKTVVAIYLMKLLMDVARRSPDDDVDENVRFSEHSTPRAQDLLRDLRTAFVVPQQALRKTVVQVFRRTPGLEKVQVLSPYQLGAVEGRFDLVVADEVHRLNVRANQASPSLNAKFRDITTAIYGRDDYTKTQLDWIRAKSRVRILMVDAHQTVRPMDLTNDMLEDLVRSADADGGLVRLRSQMRLEAPDRYIEDVRALLSGEDLPEFRLGDYDFRLYESLGDMVGAIKELDQKEGLARIVAGYAWKWVSKKDRDLFDIEEDGVQLRWNSTVKDWINSPRAVEEAGSIHTVQGYDLNYAGVIIGRDLRMDPETGRVYFDASHYFDTKGKEKRNAKLGTEKTDADILEYIVNIYSVLMSRGVKGTFLYVCDEPLREHLRKVLPARTIRERRDVPQRAELVMEPLDLGTDLDQPAGHRPDEAS